MPVYSYSCENCRIIFEVIMTFEEYEKQRDKTVCFKCNKKSHRYIDNNPPLVKYNSPGFFSTDNKGKDEK